MKRLQLSFFLDKSQSADIEDIRKKYNPIQHGLIDSHITICREDELLDLQIIRMNLRNLKFEPFEFHFGQPKRFSEWKGVLLPVFGNVELFQILRKNILKEVIENPREHIPHLTLMHPRNAICTEAIFQEIRKFSFPDHHFFQKISLIQQFNMEKWEVLEEFDIKING
ncbi:MAG: 2'-5' RNA ligase family protein [Leadbetterella sp.]|nr:2'-5' RNA ligase family protein [Leadbetterella sp.]